MTTLSPTSAATASTSHGSPPSTPRRRGRCPARGPRKAGGAPSLGGAAGWEAAGAGERVEVLRRRAQVGGLGVVVPRAPAALGDAREPVGQRLDLVDRRLHGRGRRTGQACDRDRCQDVLDVVAAGEPGAAQPVALPPPGGPAGPGEGPPPDGAPGGPAPAGRHPPRP